MDPYKLPDVAGALVPLTGLAELSIGFHPEPAVVPAALGHHKSLRCLIFDGLDPCSLEAGCLDLPNLLSLVLRWCSLKDTEVLPGITGLQRLTRIEFSMGLGPHFFDPQLVHLGQLQRMVFATQEPYYDDAELAMGRLPIDMAPSARRCSISTSAATGSPSSRSLLRSWQHYNV